MKSNGTVGHALGIGGLEPELTCGPASHPPPWGLGYLLCTCLEIADPWVLEEAWVPTQGRLVGVCTPQARS